jgi:hypothetical protein
VCDLGISAVTFTCIHDWCVGESIVTINGIIIATDTSFAMIANTEVIITAIINERQIMNRLAVSNLRLVK